MIWISQLFEEDKSIIEERKKLGQLVKKLIEANSNKESYYWIIFDTITTEFKSIILHKVKIFLQDFRQALILAHSRINSGENLELIIKDFSNKLKEDPNINSLYSYYETQGFSFEKILTDIELRKEFFLKFQELSSIMNETFLEITKDCQKEYYKDKVGKWILQDSDEFKEFRNIATKIGQYDRFHILACIIFSIEQKRKTKFVTTDEPLLNKANRLLSFYNDNKTVILEQIRELETERE